MCELLGGFTPFSEGNNYDEYGPATELDPIQIIELTNSGALHLPKTLSAVARDLVLKLLVVDPSIRSDLEDIKDHQFFKQVDWLVAAERQLTPPFIPDLPVELKPALPYSEPIENEGHFAGIELKEEAVQANDPFKDF